MRYLVAVALQFRTISFSLRYITYFLSLGVVFFVISLSIAEDMVGIIRSICENVRNEHRLQSIRMQLSTLIDFTNLKGYETLHLHSIHNISMNCKIVYSVFFFECFQTTSLFHSNLSDYIDCSFSRQHYCYLFCYADDSASISSSRMFHFMQMFI